MARMHRWRWFALLVPLLLASLAWAATSSPAVDWEVLGGGGGPAASGSGFVQLHGTLGQTVAGLSGGSGIDLTAGFWHGVGGTEGNWIYLPVVLRSY